MSKSKKVDFNNLDDGEDTRFEYKKKKQGMKFGKNGMSRHRRDKQSSRQLIKSFETGRMSDED